MAITLYKAIQGHHFCANQKPVCSFLLVTPTYTSYLALFKSYCRSWSLVDRGVYLCL